MNAPAADDDSPTLERSADVACDAPNRLAGSESTLNNLLKLRQVDVTGLGLRTTVGAVRASLLDVSHTERWR